VTRSVTCNYCNKPAVHFASSAHVYGGRDYGPIWHCVECDAWCGCHPDGSPLGTLANKQLRNARMATHAAFDPLWRDGWKLAYPGARAQTVAMRHSMRLRAYQWLAHHMGIRVKDCHIGQFDIEQCVRAMRLINELRPTAVTIREWAKQRSARNAEIAREVLRSTA
jgi:hypothetical protein